MSLTKKLQVVVNAKKAMRYQTDPMLITIKSHIAWKEGINLIQAESVLHGSLPFTYILRQGDSSYQFFVSYVEKGKAVKHTPFKIELTIRKWSYHNGTGIIEDDLNEFIPLVMHCKKSQCRPLNG